MGFFDALRRALASDSEAERGETLRRLRESWDLDSQPAAAGAPGAAEPSSYDRAQWHKKLKRVLGELPASRGEWDELMAEARALGFGPSWIERCQREEFLLLIRHAVADRHVTEAEHRKLELARELIGMSEIEATEALHSVVAEAEAFFGAPIDEG